MNLFDAVYDKEYSMNWPLMYLERTNDIIPIPLLFKPLPKSINDKTTKKNWRGVRMKIEGQINGFPLIKFKNTRIINSLKSGKIYLNSLKWFREYENELGDVVVGDS